MVKVGIIGGSGMDDPEIVDDATRITVKTPYGEPSSPLTCGRIRGVDVVILARHGHGHCISPSQVNNRANIMALKDQGVTAILATTACGSLKQEIHRGDLVILDQFIDFTRLRKNTFHDSFETAWFMRQWPIPLTRICGSCCLIPPLPRRPGSTRRERW